MKRFFLSVIIAAAGLGLFGQSLDKTQELIKANKWAEAKAEIDKVLADSKNQKNGDAWFYKCKIYAEIAANDQLKTQTPDAATQAFDALKKYVEFDNKKLVFIQLDQYKPLTQIYQGFFQSGAAAYNAAKYSDALDNFKGALEAIKFMADKGWAVQKLDTTSTLYAGITAEKANKKDEAAVYYKIIADSGITKIGGNEMDGIYKWLVDYYSRKKDYANAFKYLAVGKKAYPADLYWPDTELELIRSTKGKDSLFSKYEEINTNFPTNHLFFYNYGLELYQFASDTTSGKRPSNYDDLIKKAQEKLNKSLQIKPDYVKAALVLGQISYNAGVEFQLQAKSIKGAKPEDVKKRTELRAQANKKFDEAIPYFEKVEQVLGPQGKLKMDDKSALKDAYDLLITIYEIKNLKDKALAYTNKFNSVDKDH